MYLEICAELTANQFGFRIGINSIHFHKETVFKFLLPVTLIFDSQRYWICLKNLDLQCSMMPWKFPCKVVDWFQN